MKYKFEKIHSLPINHLAIILRRNLDKPWDWAELASDPRTPTDLLVQNKDKFSIKHLLKNSYLNNWQELTTVDEIINNLDFFSPDKLSWKIYHGIWDYITPKTKTYITSRLSQTTKGIEILLKLKIEFTSNNITFYNSLVNYVYENPNSPLITEAIRSEIQKHCLFRVQKECATGQIVWFLIKSKSPEIIKFLEENPDYCRFPEELISFGRIDLVNWKSVSEFCNIKLEFYQKYKLYLKPKKLRKNIYCNNFKIIQDIYNFQSDDILSYIGLIGNDIPLDFLIKYRHKMDWSQLSGNPHLSPNVISGYIDYYYANNLQDDNFWDWKYLSENSCLSSHFIMVTIDDPRYKYDHDCLCLNPNLTFDIFEKIKPNYYNITCHYNLFDLYGRQRSNRNLLPSLV